MTTDLPGVTPRRLLASAIVLGALCVSGAFPALAADAPATGAPPNLDLSAPGVAWAGFVAPKAPDYAIARAFNDFTNPATGLGPVTDGRPPLRQQRGGKGDADPADLPGGGPRQCRGEESDALGQGSLSKQNELVLRGRNGETREARCWETGVPAFHLNPGVMRIVQTPREVVLFLTGRVRHIWLDVPHSANPKPSWYGESVGHYDGDTLVVDTIGFNDKTFVDSYRTPHTDKLHVVERFRLIDGGNTLEVAFTVEDPGAFYQPWSGTRNRHRVVNPNDTLPEPDCATANDDYFNIGLEQVPTAEKPGF